MTRMCAYNIKVRVGLLVARLEITNESSIKCVTKTTYFVEFCNIVLTESNSSFFETIIRNSTCPALLYKCGRWVGLIGQRRTA